MVLMNKNDYIPSVEYWELFENLDQLPVSTAQQLEGFILTHLTEIMVFAIMNADKIFIRRGNSFQINDTYRAEVINDIRNYTAEQTESIIEPLRKAIERTLTQSGTFVFDNLDSRSNHSVRPEEIVQKQINNVVVTMQQLLNSKGTNYVIGKGQNIPQFFTVFVETTVKDVVEGKISLDKAIERGINALSDAGLQVINYDSGVTRQIDVWVRQEMIYAQKKLAEEIKIQNAHADGIHIFEYDEHRDARPTHQVWQGHRYDELGIDYPTQNELTHGEHDDYGCRHFVFPVYDKTDPYSWQLSGHAIDTEPFEWNGKQLEGYKARQYMRGMEREIRALKRKKALMESQGIDTKAVDAQIKRKTKEYRDFAKASKQTVQNNRLKVDWKQ